MLSVRMNICEVQYFGIDDEVLCFETRGEDAVAIRLVLSRLDDRKHLPVVELKRAA